MKDKFLICITLGSLFFLNSSSIRADHGMAGCGLGSLIIKEKDRVPQIFAATTNGTYYNQLFAITTGSSNCTSSGVVKKEKEQEVFVHLNYESLEREMASGKGEKLDTLSSLFGCPNSKEFGSVAKTNYAKLFGSKDSSPTQLLSVLKEEVHKNESLKTVCSL